MNIAPVWTADMIAVLTTEWNAGKSANEIGRRLAITRNAVVGKAHRLKLPARPSPIKATHARPAGRGCQYIAGEPTWTRDGDSIYCGDPLKHGSSFCPTHHKMAWYKPDAKTTAIVADRAQKRVFG